MRDHFVLLASYNTWMNAKLYKVASALSRAELNENRGAFFGSVIGTLNHIMVGDRIWLHRFAEHPSRPEALAPIRLLPKPQSMDEILYAELDELTEHRRTLDGVIEQWVRGLADSELEHVLCYGNSKGVRACKRFSSLILHFFNHQTHHRGQATTLLSQFGWDVGVTDLLAIIPSEEQA